MIPYRNVLRLRARKEFVSHHRHQKELIHKCFKGLSKKWRSIALHNTGNTVMQHIDHTTKNMYSTMLSQWRDTNGIELAKPHSTSDVVVAYDDSQPPIAEQNAMAQHGEYGACAQSCQVRHRASFGQASHTKAIAILAHQQIQ